MISMKTHDLQLKNEYTTNSIYSFISPDNYDIPLIPWAQKIKYLKRWAGEYVTEDEIKTWIKRNPHEHFPMESDQDDIEFVVNTWAEENLPENQFIHIEVVDDRNTGHFRIMLFELVKK